MRIFDIIIFFRDILVYFFFFFLTKNITCAKANSTHIRNMQIQDHSIII